MFENQSMGQGIYILGTTAPAGQPAHFRGELTSQCVCTLAKISYLRRGFMYYFIFFHVICSQMCAYTVTGTILIIKDIMPLVSKTNEQIYLCINVINALGDI